MIVVFTAGLHAPTAGEHNWSTMSDDQFTKLFKYMQQMRIEINEEFHGLHQDIERIYDLIDGLLKRSETDYQERLAMGNQLDRPEHWINRAATKLRVKYD
jgi:hypothetical protein